VGLGSLRSFVLLEDERVEPCRWLQSVDEPDLSFLVVHPRLVEPPYEPDVPAGDLWVIISLRQPPELSTANLLAPVVIDPSARTGQQCVLHESGYSLRHPVAALSGPPDQEDEVQDAGPTA
jgi:flagellar assembly factor FliW